MINMTNNNKHSARRRILFLSGKKAPSSAIVITGCTSVLTTTNVLTHWSNKWFCVLMIELSVDRGKNVVPVSFPLLRLRLY